MQFIWKIKEIVPVETTVIVSSFPNEAAVTVFCKFHFIFAFNG